MLHMLPVLVGSGAYFVCVSAVLVGQYWCDIRKSPSFYELMKVCLSALVHAGCSDTPEKRWANEGPGAACGPMKYLIGPAEATE